MKRFIFLFVILVPFFAMAQTGAGNPPTDLRPTLRSMTPDQKLKLLQYMRFLGASLDKECQQTYEQLGSEKRNRVSQFMALQNMDADAPMPRTSVHWKRDTVKFGNIEEGAIILDTFSVVNNGTKPYIIKQVKTSCDCTVVRYPEFPVMPGESATIRVEFDSRGKAGHSEPGIILYDNSIPNARSILYMKGNVIPRKEVKQIRN